MTWRLAAASVKGDPQKTECQDACAYALTDRGFVGVVSDGAGSAKQSTQGARLVVEEGLNTLKSLPFQDFESEIQQVCATLRTKLKKVSVNLDDCACTALFYAMHKGTLFLAQIGDGFVVTGNQGTYTLQFLGDKGEHVNETNFITDDTLILKTRVINDPIDFIAVGTDGLEEVAIHRAKKKLCPGFFKPFDAYLASNPSQEELDTELLAFLSSDRLQARSRDDRTLLVGRDQIDNHNYS